MSATRILAEPVDLTFRATGETVVDLEKLCRGVMGVERWPVTLEPADNEELLGFLLGECVVQERRYARLDGIQARPWLFQRLRWRARDWRDAFLRHQVPPELDEGPSDDDDVADFGSARRDGGSHGAPGEVAGDRGDPREDALGGLLESGDRTLLRAIAALGLSAPPGVRGSTPNARRALARLDLKRRRRVASLKSRERSAEQVAA